MAIDNQKTTSRKVLLVEDEPHLAFNLELNLKAEGFTVTLTNSGEQALDKYQKDGPFALVLLDWMIPEPDGYAVAKHIRQMDRKTPIIMLTARASEKDRLRGLELGIDDYICKPFHLQELLLKVKRHIARDQLHEAKEGGTSSPQVQCGPFSLNRESLELVTPRGRHQLTVLETDILWEFMQQEGRVLTREHLLERVWGLHGNQETRTVDNFVVRLRKFVEDNPSEPRIIESVRGRGYRFNSNGQPHDTLT